MRLPLSISPIRGLRSEDNPQGYARITDADGKFICKVDSQADAELIVDSVNWFGDRKLRAAHNGTIAENEL